jgi:molybdate transport system regulatory protein
MVRLTLRIDLDTGAFGPGKARLLEEIARTGSISGAASAMKMSYRRAWLLTQSMEESFGSPVVSTSAGGKHGGGATLTTLGETLLARYRRIEALSTKASSDQLRAFEQLAAGTPRATKKR